MNLNKTFFSAVLVGTSFVCVGNSAKAAVINFDDQGLTGPNLFRDAGPAQTLNIATEFGNVRFEGGVILTNPTNLPANRSSVYGTAEFLGDTAINNPIDPSLSNPIRITFENPIENFFLDILNGNTQEVEYTVLDNIGNSATFALPSNLDEGFQKIGFGATGNLVNVSALELEGDIPFDFFIDNITFNEELPEDLLEPIEEVVVTPPVTEPPVTEPPVTEPPVTEPPVTEPPVTESPVTTPEPTSIFAFVTLLCSVIGLKIKK